MLLHQYECVNKLNIRDNAICDDSRMFSRRKLLLCPLSNEKIKIPTEMNDANMRDKSAKKKMFVHGTASVTHTSSACFSILKCCRRRRSVKLCVEKRIKVERDLIWLNSMPITINFSQSAAQFVTLRPFLKT